jgi:hypothetical protein
MIGYALSLKGQLAHQLMYVVLEVFRTPIEDQGGGILAKSLAQGGFEPRHLVEEGTPQLVADILVKPFFARKKSMH